jgi:AAT family amino acid transporter
MIAAITPIDNT